MNLGAAIRKLRKEKDMNQQEFSAVVGISQTALSQIEKGITQPHPSTMNNICRMLGVSEGQLYFLSLEESDAPKGKYKRVLWDTVCGMFRHLFDEN